MELIAADDEGMTVCFTHRELRHIMALLHGVAVDFDKLDGQVHNLTTAEFVAIDDGFSELRGKAYDLKHGRQGVE